MADQDNQIGKTVTEIPDEMFINLGEYSMIINLGGVTVRDWLAILLESESEKKMANVLLFNAKVLGDKYLDLPLVYMAHVNNKVMEAVTRLFAIDDGSGDADSK